MYAGKLVFAQVMDHMLIHTFRRCVARYRGHYKVQSFSFSKKHPLQQMLSDTEITQDHHPSYNQLNLFD